MKLHSSSGLVVMRRVMQSPQASFKAGCVSMCLHMWLCVPLVMWLNVTVCVVMHVTALQCALPDAEALQRLSSRTAWREFRKHTRALISGPVSTSPFIRTFPQSLAPPTPIFPSAKYLTVIIFGMLDLGLFMCKLCFLFTSLFSTFSVNTFL